MKLKLVWLQLFILIVSINILSSKTDASERISDPNMGVSILPPQGEGWYYIKDNPNGGLMFGKKTNSSSHTFVCSFVVVPAGKDFKSQDKFLETVKQGQEGGIDKKRFKDIKSNYNLSKRFGLLSVEYQLSAIDMWRKDSKGAFLIQKNYGYSFIHPKQSNYMVDISCSERGSAKELSSSFEVECKEFIDGLEIK